MTQLTFDGSIENVKLKSKAGPAKTDSWYKGRTLSHSSINMYKTCPQKWKFRYVDKIPEQPRSYFSFGKSVHAGLEFLFSRVPDRSPVLDEVLAHYKASWVRDGFESEKQERWYYQEGERIIRGFYAKHEKEFDRVVDVEFRFTVDFEGVPVTGFIDRLDRTAAGGLKITDYKTGKAFDRSRVRRDPQLTLYQMAVKKLFEQPVEAVGLYHLNSLTPIHVPAHPAALEESLLTTVREAADGITKEAFEPKPDSAGHCRFCDYAQICPAFSGKKIPLSLQGRFNQHPAELADKFGHLDEKIKALRVERDEIGRSLRALHKRLGESRFDGKNYTVRFPEGPAGDIIEASPRSEDA